MTEKNIRSVTFYFSDGADPSKVDRLAQKAGPILGLWCSGGGYTPDMHYEKFSEDTMFYEFKEYKQNQADSTQQNNHTCNPQDTEKR